MNVSNLPKEARTARPANHPPVASGRVGVLIVNLGTPEGTDYWSIRRYLQEFLSDRRVIETPRIDLGAHPASHSPEAAARQRPRL